MIAALLCELADGERGLAGSEVVDRVALAGVALSEVVCELGGVETVGEASERSAGADLGELAVITDEHNLRLGASGVGEKSRELPCADHGGFVDDDHRVAAERFAVEVTEQPVEGATRDAGSFFELRRGACGERGADHSVAGLHPGLTREAKRGGLARSGDADHDVDTSP